jgi:parallel beta-helix repeat protein
VRRLGSLSAISALATFILIGGPAHANVSQTLVVDADGFATPADCDSSTATPYTTIQAAMTAANDGDTIVVCPGSYGGGIAVNKAVTLQGVGSPVISCGGSQPTFGMDVSANATVDRFSFLSGGPCTAGIYDPTAATITATNNTVSGYLFGIFTNGGGDVIGPDNSVSNSTTGIFVSSGSGTSVDDNYVGNVANAEIQVDSATNASVTDNDLTGLSPAIGIDVSGTSSGTTITGNTISGHATGLQFDGSQTNTSVNDNSISGNTVGAKNNTTSVVDMTDNWWGAATGPSDWGIGTGDSVKPNIDFFPWYTDVDRTTLRTCDGTLASAGTLYGTNASEVLCGSTGDDIMYGRGGKDLLLGNGGHDRLYGRAGDDSLIGGAANDSLHGNHGFDSLQGRAGTDSCFVGVDGGQTSSC